MQSLLDFLSFKLFISPYVLIICYYMGALGIPIASWLVARRAQSKFSLISGASESGGKYIAQLTKSNSRVLLVMLFAFFFTCMETLWRMIFEFLIAYLQMRDAIMALVIQ